MRRQRERVGFMRRALVVAGVLGLLAGVASADTTTERSASILVFPKVVADSTYDTIIQITNTSNSMVMAHCIYVNAGLTDPNAPFDPIFNPQLWQETDFDISFTRQQPTIWVVSKGRPFNPNDAPCNRQSQSCYGAGIDPGLVPQVVQPFTGELMCIEVDLSISPVPGNHLKGEATLVTLATGDVAKYNGIGLIGDPLQIGTVDDDGFLCLGGPQDGSDPRCPNGPEYSACPNTWILNHFAEGAQDPIAKKAQIETDPASSVTTELTVVPCTQDFGTQTPTSVTIQFLVYNEFETSFSTSTTVNCWANLDLSEISNAFGRDALQTDFAQTRMRPAGGPSASGFLIVGEEFHTATISDTSEKTAAAAFNAHQAYSPESGDGDRPGPDIITLSPDLLVPHICRGGDNDQQSCRSQVDCPNGVCVLP
jgi:hypothetical protein